jgi:hypothetical protein
MTKTDDDKVSMRWGEEILGFLLFLNVGGLELVKDLDIGLDLLHFRVL